MNHSIRCCLTVLVIGLLGFLLLVGGGSGGCGSQAAVDNGGAGGVGPTAEEEKVIGGGEDSDGDGVGDAVEAALSLCGNGALDSGEECDDGNVADGDGCSSVCISVSPSCGDGFVNDPSENCDDGNAVDDDDCNNNCRPPTAVQVSAGAGHTCVLKSNGRVTCWGLNSGGQLGYGHKQNIGDDPGETPAAAAKSGLGGDVDVGGKVVQITAGGGHTCALLDTGNVRCWGAGLFGRLGYGNTNNIGDDPGETPATAGDVPVGGTVIQITAGDDHTCALLDTGNVRCWGRALDGRLGYSGEFAQAGGVDLPQNIGDKLANTPDKVGDADVGGGIVQISAGGEHTCAVYEGVKIRCWGKGVFGRLGYADDFPALLDLQESLGDTQNEMSVFVNNLQGFVSLGLETVGTAANFVEAGGGHTCAATRVPPSLRCWGLGSLGRLGNSSTEDFGDEAGETPDQSFSSSFDFTQVSASLNHTCGLIGPVGTVLCWGVGDRGGLGYGNEENIGDNEFLNQAGVVPVGGRVVQISVGGDQTCAVLESGYVRCWGANFLGQLGYGNKQDVGDTAANTPDKVGNVSISGWICGNGVLETSEACDDGNTLGGDGCSAGCLVE